MYKVFNFLYLSLGCPHVPLFTLSKILYRGYNMQRQDMNIILEWWKQYFKNECSCVIFFLLCNVFLHKQQCESGKWCHRYPH